MSWTTSQWVAFGGTSVAGLCALALIGMAIHAYRSWTMSAVSALHTVPPAGPMRPTIHATVRRLPAGAVLGAWVDPQSAAGTAAIEAGPAAIAATPPRPDLLTSAERAAQLDDWIHASSAELHNALNAALADFRAAVEPAMRKARLWELRGEGGHGGGASARVELAHWRMDTPTGEYPMIVPRSVQQALAEALQTS